MDAQNVVYDKPPPGNEPDLKSEREKERPVITSSPPIKPAPHPSHSNDDDANSDAETVVLLGKDGYSPSKTRKVVNKDDGAHKDRNPSKPLSRPGLGSLSAEAVSSLVAKRNKHPPKLVTKDGSSGLSSAPTSPPHNRQTDDSESGRAKSPLRERSRLGDKIVPHKRKASASVKVESDDELDTRKARRPRLSSHGEAIPPKLTKDRDGPSKISSHSSSRQRSVSPHHRRHRRSVSTQLSSSNGLGYKKKRVPAPLTTDYHSDESSASGSPHARSSRLQNLATPATADSMVSPAKLVPHKKHLDAHGQTFLARACAKGEYEAAKARLQERPGDINHADYAGNTPLQIAALNGHDDIVKLLLEAGCNLECVNNDGDTPLLDAVDNGHLEVVKLLLDAGVNPRKTNLNGEEPLEHVTDDLENADEIRAALEDACRNRRNAAWRRPSEEQHGSPQDAYPPGLRGSQSPRHSPAAAHNPAQSRRGASSRLTKTSNAQLYKPLDDKTLRQAACRGDVETVERILQVKQGFDDAESMVGAARGGHETVMNLLLALGSSNPDPEPVPHLNADVATPILAAIGQDNIGIIKLLLQQLNFDPTKKFNGETYYEIARRRQGPAWKEEESLLKEAYDRYKKTKQKSPRQKPGRSESESKTYKRRALSPTREKSAVKATTSPNRRKSFSDDQPSVKRGPGRPRKEDRVPIISISTRDASPPASHKVATTKIKRQDTDTAANSSEGEASATKPRRKLISGRELKDEREKQRRSSMVSNNSTRDGSSPRGHDDVSEPKQLSEKYQDRAKALRRDDSKERLAEPPKRHRSSVTPPHSGEKDDGDVPAKRRRLEVDGKEKCQRSSNSSPEDRHRKPSSHKEQSSGKFSLKDSDKEAKRDSTKMKKLKEVKSEDVDMPDAPLKTEEDAALKAKRDAEKRRAKHEAAEARKREDERKLEEERKAEEARKSAEEERREEERKHKEEEERRRKQMEEEDKRRKLKEEEDKKRKQREEEDKRRKQQEEEERKRRQMEQEERIRREEEEKRQREEEEKRRREEERKAEEARQAEEARKREEARREDERKQRELLEKEQARQEEMARIRIAREAELRKMREEQEKIRLSKLPPLLRWFDSCSNPKTPETAKRFTRIHGIRYDTIVPEGPGSPEKKRELWLLNTHVAILLGEKDLSLQKYTSWERIAASDIAKQELWGVENGMYSLVSQPLWDLAETLPGYSSTLNGSRGLKMAHDRAESRKLFVAMDLFFVKISDFMSVVRTTPHLRNIKLSVQYKELPLDAEMQRRRQLPLRWKHDPEFVNRNHGAAPGAWVYMNGVVSTVTRTGNLYRVSNIPFPESLVPRRGFDAVPRDDPDFVRLAQEQGLAHILTDTERQSLTNGVGSHSTSPTSANSERPQLFNALTPVTPGASEMVNGDASHADEHSDKHLPNGINGASPRRDMD